MKLALTLTTPEIEAPVPVALLDGEFAAKVEKAAALGYHGVELMAARPDEAGARRICDLLQDSGLEAAAISSGAQAGLEKLTLLSGDAQIRARAYRRLLALIAFAAETRAPLVTIGSFRGRTGAEDRQSARGRLAEILHSAAGEAAKMGVRLVIEPLNRYETDLIFNLDEALELIEAVGHSHLGVLLDTFHINIEEPSVIDCFWRAAAAGRLWHVHIGDSNRRPPGQGHLDFAGIFHALQAAGYTGYCSAELLSGPDRELAARQTSDYCRLFL